MDSSTYDHIEAITKLQAMSKCLGLLPGALSLIEVTSKTIQALESARDTNEECEKLLQELLNVQVLLNTLGNNAKGRAHDQEESSKLLLLPDGPLAQMETFLNERVLVKLEEDTSTEGNAVKGVARAIKWPFHQKEVEEIMMGVERCKTALLLRLEDDILGL